MFGRATIRLGIGPHSSCVYTTAVQKAAQTSSDPDSYHSSDDVYLREREDVERNWVDLLAVVRLVQDCIHATVLIDTAVSSEFVDDIYQTD